MEEGAGEMEEEMEAFAQVNGAKFGGELRGIFEAL